MAVAIVAVLIVGVRTMSLTAPALAEHESSRAAEAAAERSIVPRTPTASSDGLPVPILIGGIVLAFAVGTTAGHLHRRRRATVRKRTAIARPAPKPARPKPAAVARPAPPPPPPPPAARRTPPRLVEPPRPPVKPPPEPAPEPARSEAPAEPPRRETPAEPPRTEAPAEPPALRSVPPPAKPESQPPPESAVPAKPRKPRKKPARKRAKAPAARSKPAKPRKAKRAAASPKPRATEKAPRPAKPKRRAAPPRPRTVRPSADAPLSQSPEIPRLEDSAAEPLDRTAPLAQAPEALHVPTGETFVPARRFARITPWPDDAAKSWTCELDWKAGYRKSAFRAMAAAPGASRRVPFGESPPVGWTLMADPDPPTPELAIRVRALMQALEAAGWRHIGRGEDWYAQRFVWRGSGEPQPIDVPDVVEESPRA